MATPSCSDEEFIAVWKRLSSPSLVAAKLGTTVRNVFSRRRNIENKHGIELPTNNDISTRGIKKTAVNYEGRIDLEVEDGTVVVFSDAHYWPDIIPSAHVVLLKVIKKLRPVAVICNGDAFDGGTISRFPRIGWDKKPSVIEELRCVDERLGELQKAAVGARLIWNLGNHDARFETKLAGVAPEYEGVHGFRLKDHFPEWLPAWATWINNETVIKHRIRNGVHATYNNTIHAGVNTVTGHLHQLKVTPFSDYRGRRYGVDTGTLAEPYGPQFSDYTELGPLNWHSGFVVLTFKNGKLLPPETVEKQQEQPGDVFAFRGELIGA